MSPKFEPPKLTAYLAAGEGQVTLLFLHGVGGGKEAWRDQLHACGEAGYRAIAWDMPGYGASPSFGSLTFTFLADAVVDLLDHLSVENAVLVGQSMGGMLSLEVAARHRTRVRALVLANTSAAFGKSDGAWQQQFLRARLAPLDAGLGMAEVARNLIPSIIGPDADPAGVVLALELMSRVPPATYRAALAALVTFDRRSALSGISVPVLVIAGEKDATAAPTVMHKMAEAIPGAEYVELPGAGHLANLEQPAAFNQILLDFLFRRGLH